jgi:hypothetical protein
MADRGAKHIPEVLLDKGLWETCFLITLLDHRVDGFHACWNTPCDSLESAMLDASISVRTLSNRLGHLNRLATSMVSCVVSLTLAW